MANMKLKFPFPPPAKQTAILKNWYVEVWGEQARLCGDVYGHPRFVNGYPIHTSTIVTLDAPNNSCETLNTIYTLDGERGTKEKLFLDITPSHQDAFMGWREKNPHVVNAAEIWDAAWNARGKNDARIALAIDSGRGNELEIAKAISRGARARME